VARLHPFARMPNTFDPPSGFLATANSRVTTDESPYPLTDDWADPYRIERIYKSLDGRDQLTPADMLAVQTDIYSEVDQEMGHRFAYAIDHTPGPTAMAIRSYARPPTSCAVGTAVSPPTQRPPSVVTQTRAALWPILLEPKLGKLASDYHWSESNFALEEIVMHAKRSGFPRATRIGRAADRGRARMVCATVKPRRCAPMGLRKLARRRYRASPRRASDLHQPHRRNRPPAAKRRRHHRETSCRTLGPSQRFTMDWSNIDGSTENIVLGESGNPLSPYSATSGTIGTTEPPLRCPLLRGQSQLKPATPCACCHERTGTRRPSHPSGQKMARRGPRQGPRD